MNRALINFKNRCTKGVAAILGLVFFSGIASCGSPAESKTSNPEGIPAGAVNAIRDEFFCAGIDVLGTDAINEGRTKFGFLDYEGTASETGMNDGHMKERAWELTQWASRESLAEVCNAEKTEDGTYIYSNTYKEVAVNPKKGTILLRVNGGLEYDFKPRTTETSWVHLLIEQTPVKYLYRDVKSLTAYVDFSVDEIKNYLGESEYNTSVHAAQLVWYFRLRNQKGEQIWFGIPLYDNREEERGYAGGEVFSYDKGTQSAIYSMDKVFYLGEEGAKVGERYQCVIPLNSALEFCVEQSTASGAFSEGTTADDCYLTSMNMGWEVPGTFDCQATFYKIGLYAEKL